LNFDAKCRRGSFTPEDIVLAHIAGMDSYALGLRLAVKVQEDGLLDNNIKERYASYTTGIGAEIVSGRATLESLAAYAEQKGEVTDSVMSGKQEYLESALNALMFG
jgi:xylose isomerase